MRRRTMIVLAAILSVCALAVAGASASPACISHSGLHGAGACLRASLHPTAIAPATAGPAPQGVDISNWQGVPDFGEARRFGIKFVMIQTNDGAFRNPFYWMQAAAARNAGLPFGTYTFLEGFSGSSQARISASVAAGTGRSLGMWADAEQNSAYPVTCSYVRASQGIAHIFGVYGSPGTYAGGRCPGYDWPAEWGAGRAFPLPGYPASATKIRQWCGTCRVPWHTGEIDRDESLGLLSLAKPAPTRAQQLAHARQEAAILLADLRRHGCFHVHGKRAFRLCPHWGGEWRHWQHEVKHLS